MSLKTPEKIRNFQKKLYRKAKAEPDYRFYLLYDKIYREDVLLHAYRLAKANGGAPGVDGKTFAMIETEGVEAWLAGLREELRSKTYQPQPVRRVMIPKPGGGERPLGIPTIRDRVAQTATKLEIEPIVEADLEPTTYGYRPKRRAQDAVQKVHELLCDGYTEVVDADLTRYFDTIPHREVMKCVACRIVVRNALRESFDFLGYTFGNLWFHKDGTQYMGAQPSKVSIARLKSKVRELLQPREKGAWLAVCKRLNDLLRGWAAYFCQGTTQIAYRAVERNVYERVRQFLVQRHRVSSRGIQRFSSERVFGELGVYLPRPLRASRREH
jgi:hypothetical protein